MDRIRGREPEESIEPVAAEVRQLVASLRAKTREAERRLAALEENGRG